ncbi:MAG: hypothetical protein GX915_06960, partial [Clostridiales bacterium]|nr:hypothetical protein [Clostridiales bacterium]
MKGTSGLKEVASKIITKVKLQGISKRAPQDPSLKEAKGISKIFSIRVKLVIGLLIPVVLLALYGVISYNKSESAIISNYENSSAGTLNAVSDYMGFGLNIIGEKTQELISDPNVRVYYNKKTGNEDYLTSLNQQYDIQTDIILAKDTNPFVAGIHVIGQYGKGTSTEVPASDTLYGAFSESEKGIAIEGISDTYTWIGSHPELDTQLTDGDKVYSTDNYALSIVRKMSSNYGYVIVDVSMEQVMDMFDKYDLGEGSITGLVTGDGREVITGSITDTVFSTLPKFQDIVKGTDDNGFFYEDYNGEEHLFLYSKVTDANLIVCALIPRATIL